VITKYYTYGRARIVYPISLIFLLPLGCLTVFILYNFSSEFILGKYIFFAALIIIQILFVIGILINPLAVGINPKHLIIRRLWGKLHLPWELINDFYPLNTTERGSFWAITTTQIPLEYKLSYWHSLDWLPQWLSFHSRWGYRLNEPSIVISAYTDTHFEAIQSIRAHIDQAQQSAPS